MLTGASVGNIVHGTGTGTILDDDPTPVLSISDVLPTAEGAAGTTRAFTFRVSLSAASATPVTVA